MRKIVNTLESLANKVNNELYDNFNKLSEIDVSFEQGYIAGVLKAVELIKSDMEDK